ncbi:MAG: redoxin domain-containing protein [Anaerolineae bacterium]
MFTDETVSVIPPFELKDHEGVAYHLDMLMGERGTLLGFTGDVWEVSSVRYVLWLQRQHFKLASKGIQCALIIPNQPYELNGFYLSIPRKITFPLLADPNRDLYDAVGMDKSGYMAINDEGVELARWYLKETATLSMNAVLYHFKR